MITEILISPSDDPRVIDLFGVNRLKTEEKAWLDMKVTTVVDIKNISDDNPA